MTGDIARYRHTQTGWVLIVALTIPAVAVIFLTGARPPLGLILPLVFALLLVLFHSMTVRLEGDRIRIAFGPGLIRTHVRLDSVRGHRIVRNPWYYGWGIHVFPRGVLYNVSGMQAVELELANGRLFRIGTDEPDALEAAIAAALGHR
jgi:hypothetical protein